MSTFAPFLVLLVPLSMELMVAVSAFALHGRRAPGRAVGRRAAAGARHRGVTGGARVRVRVLESDGGSGPAAGPADTTLALRSAPVVLPGAR
ncbi:hypothetical protein ACFWXO_05300 [Kitasatospora sp. NPDC059088]|uniref:hypothetical protein n=1 Tax=Kitasatospora sp. NPDC059088 TaxID=3346722 RepID=UPI0036C45EE0